MPFEVEPAEAVQALLERGVNQPQTLLQHGTPAQILAACHRYDRQQGVTPGLLVKWIRNRQFEEEPAIEDRQQQRRARFTEYAREFPWGSTVETHRDLIRRRWPDDLDRTPCPGSMIVVDATYPLITLECNDCGFEAAIGPRGLHVLGAPEHHHPDCRCGKCRGEKEPF